METLSRHHCLIYDGPPSQKLTLIALIIRQNLNEDYRCLYLNSPAMVAELQTCLRNMGTDVEKEINNGRLILSSEPVTKGSVFDWQALLADIEKSLDEALRDGYKGLFATGDMTWEFGAVQDLSQLLEYEFGLEKKFHRRPELRGICQYHKDTLPPEIMRKGLISHSSVVLNNTLRRINPLFIRSANSYRRSGTDFELDQVVNWLCSEVAQRSA